MPLRESEAPIIKKLEDSSNHRLPPSGLQVLLIINHYYNQRYFQHSRTHKRTRKGENANTCTTLRYTSISGFLQAAASTSASSQFKRKIIFKREDLFTSNTSKEEGNNLRRYLLSPPRQKYFFKLVTLNPDSALCLHTFKTVCQRLSVSLYGCDSVWLRVEEGDGNKK